MKAQDLADQVNEAVGTHGSLEAPVRATTPHGTYLFDIDAVDWDAVEQYLVLRLVEVVPEKRKGCPVCARPREEWPAIFQNDDACSVVCQKLVEAEV